MSPLKRHGKKNLEQLKGTEHDVWTFFFEFHLCFALLM